MVIRLNAAGITKWGDRYHRYAKAIGIITSSGLEITDAAWGAVKPAVRAHVRGNSFVEVVDAPIEIAEEKPVPKRRSFRSLARSAGGIVGDIEDEG